jgi:hypothetical protein
VVILCSGPAEQRGERHSTCDEREAREQLETATTTVIPV